MPRKCRRRNVVKLRRQVVGSSLKFNGEWDILQGGSTKNYDRVQHNLGIMRENGSLPFEWIADSTRYRRIPSMYDSAEDALKEVAELYRRDLWTQQPRHIEVWAESDSITGVIDQVARVLGVGLFSCRGQASKSFAHGAALEYRRKDKPVTILYVGDWDPSGLGIARSLLDRLMRYSKDEVEIDFERLAVASSDIRGGRFVTHPVNKNDPHLKRFQVACKNRGLDPNVAMEVEAISSTELRTRLSDELYSLVEDIESWNATLVAEESEREILMKMRV